MALSGPIKPPLAVLPGHRSHAFECHSSYGRVRMSGGTGGPNGAFVPPPISQLSVAPQPVGAPALSRRVSETVGTDRVFLTAVEELVREKASMPLQCRRSAGRSRDGKHIWKSGPEAARLPVQS